MATRHRLPGPSRSGIFEVGPYPHEGLPTTPATTLATAPVDAWWAADVLGDHNGNFFSISASCGHDDQRNSFFAQHQPFLVEGTHTVNDPSQTSIVRVKSGFSAARNNCAALVESGLQTTSFIKNDTLGTLQTTGDASEACVTEVAKRSWGSFGNKQALETSKMVRLSVQLYHDDLPTTWLAVLVHVMSCNTTRHSLLLRHHNLRFKSRSHLRYSPAPSPRTLSSARSPSNIRTSVVRQRMFSTQLLRQKGFSFVRRDPQAAHCRTSTGFPRLRKWLSSVGQKVPRGRDTRLGFHVGLVRCSRVPTRTIRVCG